MSWDKSTNSCFWPQADVNVLEASEDRMERKRKVLSEEVTEQLSSRSEVWNVTKRKRSGGGRMRSANVKLDCTGNAHVRAFTPTIKDVEAIQDVTGIDNQAGMDSLNLSSKHRTKMLPNAHIEKFLAGNSKPMAGMRKNMMKSTLFEARVHHTTNVSRFLVEETDVNRSAREFPDKGGPLYKRLLSALIDENQDFDHQSDEKTNPSRMAEWEMDFLDPVPDENLLLKELHLVGIYPEILPGLVDDNPDQDNEERQKIIYPELASETPKRPRGRPRTKHLKNPIPEKNETNKESIPKKKRGRKPKNPQMDKCQEVKEPTLEICETKSKTAAPSVPKVIPQELKSASPRPSTENLITVVDSTKELDMIDFNNNPPEDLSLMLDLDDLDDILPQNGDDADLSCLDIPMDDITTLNFNFWP